MNKLNNNKGAAMLIALVLMALLTTVAIMAVNRSTTDVELSFNQQHEEKAFYIAEAGAKLAYYKLDEDLEWRDGYNDVNYGDGSYTVSITDSSTNSALYDTVIIRSTGTFDKGMTVIEIEVVPSTINPFSSAMLGKTLVEIKNSFATDSYNSDSGTYAMTVQNIGGDVGSNGDIVIKNNGYVGGNVSTSLDGGLSINNGATVTGDTTSSAPYFDIPDIPSSTYDLARATNDNLSGISGSFTYNSSDYSFVTSSEVTFTTGTYYFESFELKNKSSLVIPPGDEVTIYVNGDVIIKNSAPVNADGTPDDLMIYSTGDIELKNSSDFTGVIYAPNADVDLKNSADYYGALVANNIINHNSADFHYDRDLANLEWQSNNGVEMVSWGEIY